MSFGTLYLIPAPLGDTGLQHIVPPDVLRTSGQIRHWVVENAKTARRFIKAYAPELVISSLQMAELNEHTPHAAVAGLLAPLLAGHDVGLMSEAGCPGVADPGALLVRQAHLQGIRVAPLVGPSSILLALMASGSSGQRFRFHGYLPVETEARNKKLRELERDSAQFDEAQLFIETPYRNDALLDGLLAACKPASQLTIARDLTCSDELILTCSLAEWQKRSRPDLKKRPAIFVLYAGR